MSFSLLENYKSYSESFHEEGFFSHDSNLILVKSGCLQVSCGNETHLIGQNEGILLSNNTKYQLDVLSPITYYLFRFRSDYPIFLETKISFSDVVRIQSTFALLDILDENHSASDFTYRKSIFNDLVTQYCIERCKNTTSKSLQEPLIADTIAYLQSHIRTSWQIEDIADRYNVTPSQLSNRFRAVTNMTLSKYMTYLKLQRAKDLLVDSNLRIKEIATECGFSNEYYFSNFFKKHTSVSPANFRKELLDIRE